MRAIELIRRLPLAAALLVASCGHARPPSDESARRRYLEAVDARLDGDSERYMNELIALAHEAPNSRAGRRARATLAQGGVVEFGAMVAVATAVLPALAAASLRSRQAEARVGLHALASFELAWRAEHGAFATTLPREVTATLQPRRFFFFIGAQEALAAPALESQDAAAREARAALDALGLSPRLSSTDLLFAAVANLDEDADADVWIVDTSGTVIHYADDLP